MEELNALLPYELVTPFDVEVFKYTHKWKLSFHEGVFPFEVPV